MLPAVIYISDVLQTIYQIVTAGVAITAIALLMYASNFNFRDRIVLTFSLILVCVTLSYSGDTLASVANDRATIQFFLQLKWTGLLLLPAAYLHFSGELLTLTGRPSRGRRRIVQVLTYIISVIGAVLVWLGFVVGKLAPDKRPMDYLMRNDITLAFGVYYLLVMAMASYNLVRAYLRARTDTTRRRLLYLLAGAAAPALSCIIFMFHGNEIFARNPDIFWLVSILGAALTGLFIILMAYGVSFFGVTWTDRIIRNRLFRWLLRGPFVAAVTLGLTTAVRRIGLSMGNPYIAFVPMVMVSTIIGLEFLINVFSPKIEKKLFRDNEQEDLDIIQNLNERMLTRTDLNQFLETITASVCDRLQVANCAIAILENGKSKHFVLTGQRKKRTGLRVAPEVIDQVKEFMNNSEGFIEIEGNGYLPLVAQDVSDKEQMVGVLAVPGSNLNQLDEDQMEAISQLAERAALAIRDRQLQQQILHSVTSLQQEVDIIQNMRASASYEEPGLGRDAASADPAQINWVRDALTHYWGGPKLTNNPLLELNIVRAAGTELEGNRTNGLRSILKEAIERTKPQGERKFTGDWLLYNLLDMKYVQGKKVREVANKLAISEADLYRKQRVAIDSVAGIISEMEEACLKEKASPDSKPNKK
ncbi:MAG: histidine kinase N-terminal 7TM domain-containing protein [Anaerolineaceae bacterium]|nr:histidine kinase N-terminal 7TM domain-containing protein [Anaerolineaceae bacterium]